MIERLKKTKPLIIASGPWSQPAWLSKHADIAKIKEHVGAIVTKTITYDKREGVEYQVVKPFAADSWFNRIGLKNEGVWHFLENDLPFLRLLGIPVIASITLEAKVYELVEVLQPYVDAFEINLGCPSVSPVASVGAKMDLRLLREDITKTMFVKVPPNLKFATDIITHAPSSKIDAVVMSNSKPLETYYLGRFITGGVSGPVIRPEREEMQRNLSLVVAKTKLPTVACGGISDIESARKALETADLIQIGCQHLDNPDISWQLASQINKA